MSNEKLDNDEITIPLAVVRHSSSTSSGKDNYYTYPSSIINESLKKRLEKTITHPAIIVPARRTAEFRRTLKDVLMKRPRIRDVYPLTMESDFASGIDPKTERKIVLTRGSSDGGDNDDNDERKDDNFAVYQEPILKELLSNGTDDSNKDTDTATTVRKSTHEVKLGYDDFSVEQVLSSILPKDVVKEIPSSFEMVGYLAHLNLREEHYPYKFIIGKLILDKTKSLKIVVNKTGTIQNEFRTFPMEVLAADDGKKKNWNEGDRCEELVVEVKEDGCAFDLDFAKVYWNSRLQFEHKRLVKLIAQKDDDKRKKVMKRNQNSKKEQENSNRDDGEMPSSPKSFQEIIVADACAGIGPFAIPLTSQYHNITVHANDLNPESFKYLKINSKKNKCSESDLKLYNMDAREFLRRLDNEGVKYQHVLMNLPAIAPEFLNVFRGWEGDYAERPMIHVHCFDGKDEAANDAAIARCQRALGCSLDKVKDEVSVHIVRNVSPKKNMLCVSFRLPHSIKDVERISTFGNISNNDEENEITEETRKNAERENSVPLAKRPRIGEENK